MNPRVLCTGIATATATAAFAASLVSPAMAAPPGADVVALEASWSKAVVAHDFAMIKAIIAPDWHGQNTSGKYTDRAALLADLVSGKDKVSSMTNHDVHVRFVGNLAIAQGMDTEVSSHDGKSTSGTYSWMDVFEKRAGHWVAIASQNTLVKK